MKRQRIEITVVAAAFEKSDMLVATVGAIHAVPATSIKFEEYELDCDRYQLRRAGRNLKLEKMPMELLILLATKNGHLVTRPEIVKHLWGDEVFVDSEHGINTAIRKIRMALRDDSEKPRFLETVTGKGYRFIGPVTGVVEAQAGENRISAPVDSIQAAAVRIVPAVGTQDEGSLAVAAEDGPRSKPFLSPKKVKWMAAFAVPAAICLLIVAAAFNAHRWRGRLFGRNPTPVIETLAVLPLDNLSGDPGQEYFADGMTDELITMLAKNSTLRVVSRTSVMQYKGARRPLPEIAKALGVDGILEGSVSRSADKVHMTIQLIQAPSDTHVWAESYDRDANDVAALPREVAIAIAKRLDSPVLHATASRYVSPEAHDAYLHGLYLWFTSDNEKAGAYFKKATELQPDYAPGWSGLANYYGAGAIEGELDPREALALEEAAAVKAVTLDNSLAEAHHSMSAALFIDRWDWARAEAEVARAIELDPKFAEAYHFHAKMLAALNRHQEAIAEQQKAMELDALERPWAMARSLIEARQYDAAIGNLRQLLEENAQDQSAHWLLCETYRRKSALKEAAEEWERASLLSGDKESAESVRRAFERGGYQAVLLWRLRCLKLESAKHYVSPVNFALQYAQLGRREETLALLEEGYRQRSPLLLWIQNDPAYDFLHTDERYRTIIRKIGLPPAY